MKTKTLLAAALALLITAGSRAACPLTDMWLTWNADNVAAQCTNADIVIQRLDPVEVPNVVSNQPYTGWVTNRDYSYEYVTNGCLKKWIWVPPSPASSGYWLHITNCSITVTNTIWVMDQTRWAEVYRYHVNSATESNDPGDQIDKFPICDHVSWPESWFRGYVTGPGSPPGITNLQVQMAGGIIGQGLLVVVDSSRSAYLPEFKSHIQPMLDTFGFPYDVCNLVSNTIPSSLENYSAIVVGHTAVTDALQDADSLGAIKSAVATGVGFVVFDTQKGTNFLHPIFNATSIGGTNVAAAVINSAEHYITALHTNNELIPFRNSMPAYRHTGPTNETVLVSYGSVPFLTVAEYGSGRAVNFVNQGWMDAQILGPVAGMDDLVWRSIVWAARKPLVMRGLPPMVTMRVDDVKGGVGPHDPYDGNSVGLDYVYYATNSGFKPFLALFYGDLSVADTAELSGYVNSGRATASVHSVHEGNSGFFYFDHQGHQPWSWTTFEDLFNDAASWHASNGIPISTVCVPHYSEIGPGCFELLTNWFKYTQLEVEPGGIMYEYSPPANWLVAGPYRLYDTQQAAATPWPFYYADWLGVPGHTNLNGFYFNILSEVREIGGCNDEWCPSDNTGASISNAVAILRRQLNSMVQAQLYTHESHIKGIWQGNWETICQSITNVLATPYDPQYVTLDYQCQYVRATKTSALSSCSYNIATKRLDLGVIGTADLPTSVYVFTEGAGGISSALVSLPAFNTTTNFIVTTP